MSTTSEQRAWQGPKPASLTRSSQSRSSNASPKPQNIKTPASPQPPRSEATRTTDEGKSGEAPEKKSHSVDTHAKSKAGNVWEQRKSAAQGPGRSTSAAPSTTAPREGQKESVKKAEEGKKKAEESGKKANVSEKIDAGAGGAQKAPSHAEEKHVAINEFNESEVQDMLRRGASAKIYKIESGKTAAAWGSKAHQMANNQPFFVQLSRQVAALEGKR